MASEKSFALLERRKDDRERFPTGWRIAQVERIRPTKKRPVPFPVAEGRGLFWHACRKDVTAEWQVRVKLPRRKKDLPEVEYSPPGAPAVEPAPIDRARARLANDPLLCAVVNKLARDGGVEVDQLLADLVDDT